MIFIISILFIGGLITADPPSMVDPALDACRTSVVQVNVTQSEMLLSTLLVTNTSPALVHDTNPSIRHPDGTPFLQFMEEPKNRDVHPGYAQSTNVVSAYFLADTHLPHTRGVMLEVRLL